MGELSGWPERRGEGDTAQEVTTPLAHSNHRMPKIEQRAVQFYERGLIWKNEMVIASSVDLYKVLQPR
jgi:hypothetical protein